MYTLLYTISCTNWNFIRVSATPYSNYSLLCILLLKVFCSTIWNLVLGILYYVELRTWYYMVLYLWNFVLYFSNSYSLLHIRYLLLCQVTFVICEVLLTLNCQLLSITMENTAKSIADCISYYLV